MEILIYVALFICAVGFMVVASSVAGQSTRACPHCGEETPTHGRRCRHCGYSLGRAS